MSKVKLKMTSSEYIKHLEGLLKAQGEEVKELHSWKDSMVNDDPSQSTTVNLDELGFMDCGANSWEFIDFDDIDGGNGTETWRDPKTNKYYEIQWERVRHITEAKEVK